MENRSKFIDMAEAFRCVIRFCYNHLDSLNYAQVAREIHGTDMWTYKYAEIIFNKDCRAWPSELVYLLPEEQAAQLIEYCLNYYAK